MHYLTSSDAQSWAQTRGNLPAAGTTFDIEEYDNRLFVAPRVDSTGKANFFRSSDGSTWESIPSNLAVNETRRFIRTPNAWFMNCSLVGMTARTPTLYRSTDLQNWTVVYEPVSDYAFFPYGGTNMFYLNNRLFISDTTSKKTLIIEDV